MTTSFAIKTLFYKACPRCRGDLVLDPEADHDSNAEELLYVCLQCGRPMMVRRMSAESAARQLAHAGPR